MKKHKSTFGAMFKKLLLVILICLALLVLIPVICWVTVHLGKADGATDIQHVETLKEKRVAIIPGTSGADGTLTEKAKDRLQAVICLYEKGIVSEIIVSGSGKEGKTMAQYLMRKGISSEVISTDMCAVDTYDTIARVKEKYGDESYYFCTQKLYGARAGYLMKRIGLNGIVVYVDTMYYSKIKNNALREFFAATKAVFESFVRGGKPKTSIKKEDFTVVEEAKKNPHFVYPEEVETPEDCVVEDVNPEDGYDVNQAVQYARTYALERNSEYGQFEQNCTNFVSQCLVAGGISMQGEGEISKRKRWNISNSKEEWYSNTQQCGSDNLMHYSVSQTFINTDAFLEYFTEVRGYKISLYDNGYTDNLKFCEEAKAGDVLILYREDGTIAHLGLISGIGNKNVYYCGNTAGRRDYTVFAISATTYAKIGVLHMSQ